MKPLKLLLIESESVSKGLAPILLSNHYSVINATTSSQTIQLLAAENKPDIVIFNILSPRPHLQDITLLNQKLCAPIIIFATDDSVDTINQVVKAGVSAYVVNSLDNHRINSIITIATARFKELHELKIELEKTKSKLEERKLVDRAKGILIKTRGFTEDEAYHTLRKLAMDRNISVAEMAKNVISMAELLK
ncbi:MAG: ANTAR domain-containing protein [Methylococcaceae bacterium]|jgi:response regulator NasT